MTRPGSLQFIPRIFLTRFLTRSDRQRMAAWCAKLGITRIQLVPKLYGEEAAFPPRDRFEERAELLATVVSDLARLGIRTDFNVGWFCHGFRYEGRTGPANVPYEHVMRDVTGNDEAGIPCLLDPSLREYACAYYGMLAKAGPGVIMVDDNFRYAAHGNRTYCFCAMHVKAFNGTRGRHETFESITAACEDPAPNPLKKAYIAFKRYTLLEVAERVRESVRAVNPKVSVGLMLTSSNIACVDGRDARELVEAFAGERQPVARTGFGWYSDRDRTVFLHGLADSVFQKSILSPGTEVQSEIDWWPHTPWRMSPRVRFGTKVRAHVVSGFRHHTIYAFHWLQERIGPDHPDVPVLARALAAHERVARAIPDRARLTGVQVGFSESVGLERKQSGVRMYGSGVAPVLWRLGIPVTFDRSPVAVLTAETAPRSRKEAEAWLEDRNVLLDADAVFRFAELGLAPRLGIRLTRWLGRGEAVHERPARHPVNRGTRQVGPAALFAGEVRRAWTPRNDDLRPITHLYNLAGRCVSPGVLAGAAGGRRAALLPYALSETPRILDRVRQIQIRNLLAWLSSGTLRGWTTGADLAPILLDATDKQHGFLMIASVLNVGTQASDGERLTLSVPARTRLAARYADAAGRLRTLGRGRYERKGRKLTLFLDKPQSVAPLDLVTFRVESR